MSVDQHLGRLETADLIRVSKIEPELEYLFRHALIQQAAYESILKADRRELHRLVGEAVENLGVARDGENAAVLAHHFALAEEHERALHYFTLAGDASQSKYANPEAIRHYSSALEALSSLSENADHQRAFIQIVLKLARVSAFYPMANIPDLLAQALTAAETLADDELLARVLGSSGATAYTRGQIASSMDFFNRCIPLAEKLGLDDVLLVPYNMVGRTMIVAGHPRALAHLKKGIALAEKFDDRELLSGSLAVMATGLINAGRRTEADEYIRRALQLATEFGPARIAGTQMIVGATLAFYVEDDALDYLLPCIEAAEAHGMLYPLYICLGGLGYFYVGRGDIEKGRAYLDRSVDIARQENRYLFVPVAQAVRANLVLREGDSQAAFTLVQEALSLAEKTGQGFYASVIRMILGRMHAETDPPRWELAEQLINDATETMTRSGATTPAAVGTFELGRLYARQGRIEEARNALKKARAVFKRAGLSWYHGQAQAALNALK